MENANEIKTSPVYASVMTKPRIFGIGEKAFYGIVVLTVVLMSMVSVFCIGIGIIMLVVLRLLCRKEPLLVDFLIENISESDFYEG